MGTVILAFLKKQKYIISLLIVIFLAGMYTEYKLFFPKKLEIVQEQEHPTTWNEPKLTDKDFNRENYDKCLNCANSKLEMNADEIRDEWIRVTVNDACKSTFTDYKIRAPYTQKWGLGLTYYFLYANKEISQSAGIDLKYRYGSLDFAAGPILPVSGPKIYGLSASATYWFNI